MKEQSGNFPARFSTLNTKKLSAVGWSCLSYRLLVDARSERRGCEFLP